jgi:TonB family protein
MKNFILLFVLASTLTIWMGCSPGTKETTVEQDKEGAAKMALVKSERAEELQAKKARHAKMIAEREQTRIAMLVEKAKATPTYKDADGNVVYYKAEMDPSYAGGMDELRAYLKNNLKYPVEAQENGYEGTVFVDFVIDANGKVRNVTASDVIGENIDASFKEESVRVVSAMPGWKAGRQNGKAVDTSFSLPITFEMAD